MNPIEEALEFIRVNDIKWVDLQFFDFDSQLRHITLSSKIVDENFFKNGIEVDLSNIFGYEKERFILLPDPETYARLPWDTTTVRFISSIYHSNKERYLKDVRYFAERVSINLKALGYNDFYIDGEIEFNLFDSVTGDKLSPERGPNFLIDSREAYWNPTPFWNFKRASFISPPFDTLANLRAQLAEFLNDNFRINITAHAHGKSSCGQQSISFSSFSSKNAADTIATIKYVTKNIAYSANLTPTFMAYPILNEKGNSLLLGFDLRKGIESIFFKENELTDYALYFIGGILEHAKALTIFIAQTTNSYKKLMLEPKFISWGHNSSNLVRPFANKITFTAADSAVNPYIAIAAISAAGIDGIKNKISPPKQLEDESADSKKLRDSKIKQLPLSITEAIEALESDNKFLKGFISSEFLSIYLEKLINEDKENKIRPTQYEFERYFNL